MSNKNGAQRIKTGSPDYVVWRGELLAELALARLGDLSIYKPKEDTGYDFLVTTPTGACFFVQVKAFSSWKLGVEEIDQVAELQWQADEELIRRAKECQSPVFLFLIDADTEHGRYLRLDTVEADDRPARSDTLRFPRENSTDKEGMQRLVSALESSAVAH